MCVCGVPGHHSPGRGKKKKKKRRRHTSHHIKSFVVHIFTEGCMFANSVHVLSVNDMIHFGTWSVKDERGSTAVKILLQFGCGGGHTVAMEWYILAFSRLKTSVCVGVLRFCRWNACTHACTEKNKLLNHCSSSFNWWNNSMNEKCTGALTHPKAQRTTPFIRNLLIVWVSICLKRRRECQWRALHHLWNVAWFAWIHVSHALLSLSLFHCGTKPCHFSHSKY